MSDKIKGLTELISVIEKYPEALGKDSAYHIHQFGGMIKLEIVKSLFKGIPLQNYYSHYIDVCNTEWCSVGLFGKEEGKCYIAWEDNDKVPEDEWLFKVWFSSGAYIFGQHYPRKVFGQFFEELKGFGPKYLDSSNHALFFEPDKAKMVYDALPELFKKYKEIDKEESKADKIKALEEQLNALKGN